jgi:hypothetical protein
LTLSAGDAVPRDLRTSETAIAGLIAEVEKRRLALGAGDRGGYVLSELFAVDRVLSRIQADGLARGPLFCEWGRGLGGVCGVAALNGFSPRGIEIQGDLVDSARLLAAELELPMTFAEGTFLLPGDEDLAVGMGQHTRRAFNADAWDQLDLAPEDCDVVFAYPWPGEEASVDGVFSRHTSPGALLVTFHDWDHVLVQRTDSPGEELKTLGWM